MRTELASNDYCQEIQHSPESANHPDLMTKSWTQIVLLNFQIDILKSIIRFETDFASIKLKQKNKGAVRSLIFMYPLIIGSNKYDITTQQQSQAASRFEAVLNICHAL